jgi:hypothetical protein
MKRSLTAALAMAVLIGPAVAVARAEISAEMVRKAITNGVNYLKQQQHHDGSWSDYLGQPGGVTALCTLALLNAGVPLDDPVVQLALENLRRRRPQHTYVVSLQTMVLCRAEPKKDEMLIARNVEWLEANQISEGAHRGAWSYPVGGGDGSNAQFALLALNEAQRAADAGLIKVRVKPQTWLRAKEYWEGAQNAEDGSFGYYVPLPGTGSMTCAGITSLIITNDMVSQSDARAHGDRIDCCGQGDLDNDRIERALAWLGRANVFSLGSNPGQHGDIWLLYYLYGIERVGRLTARRFIGGHDWYREGADLLVRQQDQLSGYWKGRGHAEDDPLVATPLALLFLSKGRWPVLLAKLKHGPGEDWNQHRNDMTNLTRYVESRWKRDLTWQAIDLSAASADDLLQAPVLYFCGNRSPLPLGEEQRTALATKLRDYLDRGGFLFAEGYCGGTGFDQGFRELMTLVFPEPEYRLKLLDPSHPIWHAEEKVAADQQRPLLGIEFGCRTSVVYAPPDPPAQPRPSLSCLWELSRSGRQQAFTLAVQSQVDAARSIGINVLAYATNRELANKDEIQATSEHRSTETVDRGLVRIAKLRHPGGCDAAPRALTNLMEAAGRELKRQSLRLDAHSTLLNINSEQLFSYHMVFMHGRNGFRLTDGERANLKTYLERGGILFADAICANRDFTASFRREMAAMFPNNPLKAIPADDPMWTTHYGGFDLSRVTRRDPQPSGSGGPLKAVTRQVPPELEGIKLDDRYGVIFSQFDLSCALEKHDSLECRGYSREDAARIGINVLLYSLH